jgi:hypothetical protein
VITAEDAARVAGKIIKQPEFGRRGGRQFPSHPQLHGAGVDDHLFEADDGRRGGPFEAAQYGLHPRDQFPGCKRLGDVVVCPQLQAEDTIVFTRPGGEKNDRYRAQTGMAAQTASNIEAIAPRNHDVQQKKRRRLAFGVGNEVCWSAEDTYAKTGGFQMMLHQTRNVRIVFENEYALTQLVFPHVRAAQDSATLT